MNLLWLIATSFVMSSNKGIVRTQLTNCSYQSVQEYLGLDKDNIKMTSLRPVHHWKTPTLVLLDLYVSSITEVNEKAQTFSPHIYVEMGWVNEFTKWNATDFCGITFMSVPKEMLWIPDITVMEIIRTEFSTNEAPFLKMLSEGFVNGGQAFTLTSVCKMDLYRFPFDTQSCTLTLQSSLHTIEEFHIEAYSNASSLTAHSKEFFVNKGEWELISINMSKSFIESSGRVWDQLIYTITIKRRPLLYVVIFFLPLLYFLVLDLASFFISDDGGEKLSFKVTLLLGISVLLLILHDMLPSTSEDLPLIGVYCSIIFTFTAVSLLETILVNFLKNRKLQVVQKLAGETMADSARLDGGERPPQHTPVSPGSGGESQNSTVLQQIVTELQKQHQETEKQKAAQKWTKVAEVIDKMFFSAYVSGVGLFLQQILTAWFPELS